MHTQRWILLLLVVLGVAAWAETTVPVDQPGAVTSPPASAVGVGLSMIGLDINGNVRRFEQYATPPEGVAAGINLRLMNANGQALDLYAPEITGSYRRGGLWMLGAPSLALGFDHVSTRFYNAFDAGAERITRVATGAEATVGFGRGTLLFSNHDLHQSTPSRLNDAIFKTSRPGVDFLLPVGQGVAGVGYTHEAYTFYGAPEFDGSDQSIRFRLSPLVSDRSTLEATAALIRTVLPTTVGSPNRLQLGLVGTHALSPTWALNGEITSNSLTDVITQNGYAKRDTLAQARLEYSGIARTRLAFGAGTRDVEYINDTQTLEFNSRVANYFAGVTMRPTRTLRVKASMHRWNTDGAPERTDTLGTPTGSSVMWSRRDLQKAEISLTPSWRTGITAGWRRYAWVNGDFGAKSSLIQHDVNLWWVPRENMTVYTALTNQAYGLLGLDPTDGQSATNANSVVAGFSLQVSPTAALDASYTDVDATGGENTKQHILGIGWTSKLPHGELSLRFARDLFRESAASALDYDANYTEGRYSLEF